MNNPSPNRITDNFYRLWSECTVPHKRFGGMYTFKPGYHGSRDDNKRNWPRNYSIIRPLDLLGPSDKTAAFDLTLPREQMLLVGQRIDSSIKDPNDTRLDYLRECYGTLDGVTVYGKIHNSLTDSWKDASSDSSHLWHWHFGLFRAFVNSVTAINGIISVINEDSEEIVMGIAGLKEGDGKNKPRGNPVREAVTELQRKLDYLGFEPILLNWTEKQKKEFRFDGIFGEAVYNAMNRARVAWGAKAIDFVDGWFAYRLDGEIAKKQAERYGRGEPSLDDIKDAFNAADFSIKLVG